MARMGRMKAGRKIALLLVVALVVTLAGTIRSGSVQADSPRPNPFPDVPEHFWARTEIAAMAEKGIVAGKPGGRFDPNSPVTRGQFALMLYRALELPAGQARFKDVQPNTLLGQAVGAMVEHGIARGYPDGRYRPNEPITRGQMAVMLTRALGLEEEAIARKDADLSFADRFVETQRGYIYVVSYYGLIRGSERNGKLVFRAGHSASRAETAVILYRMLAMMEDGRLTDRDPAKVKEKAYLIAHRVAGLLPSTEGMPYVNPVHNERWIVWMAEKRPLDPGLPKPEGISDALLRQAVLGWYDSLTGTVQTMTLPYVFAYRSEITEWDIGSFEKLPPVFGLHGDSVYVVYPDQPTVLHRIDLKTGQRSEQVLPRNVIAQSSATYPRHPLPIQNQLLLMQPDYAQEKSVHYFYDLATDTSFQFEAEQDVKLMTGEHWAVWHDSRKGELIVYDRKKGDVRRFDGFDGVLMEGELAGDWFVYRLTRMSADHVGAIQLETGQRLADMFEDGTVWTAHPHEEQVLFRTFSPMEEPDKVEAYVYDLKRHRWQPFPAFNGLKRNQLLDLKAFTADDGRVYLVAKGSVRYGNQVYLFDWDRRQYLGRYNFGIEVDGRIECVGIQKGELIGLWHNPSQDGEKAEGVYILRVPLEQFSVPAEKETDAEKGSR